MLLLFHFDSYLNILKKVIESDLVLIFFFIFFLDQSLRFWVQKYGWREEPNDMVFIANQDENIKTKNITEKIDFDSVAAIMAMCR